MIDRFERFSFAISEISKYWHKIATDEMEKHGLKGNHSVYLIAMTRYVEEGLTSAQLCELCGRDKADVSRMMAIMEERGLVRKEGTNQKLYRGVYRLTEAGKGAAASVRERASLAVELAGQDLTDENRKIFYESLETVASKLRTISKEGLPE